MCEASQPMRTTGGKFNLIRTKCEGGTPMRRGPRKRSRGSALIAVMMVIAMLMAVVLALSHYQSVARQTYMTEEASLRFREGMKFEMRRQVLNQAPPSGLLVGATVENVTAPGTAQLTPLMANKIFDRNAGLPDLKNIDKSSAHEILKLKPSTPDVGLRVFGSNTYTLVMSRIPGYAAYSPKGKITIKHLEGWANPAFNDPRTTTEAFSGVKALVCALKDCTVSNATYAEAHTVDGTVKIESGNGVAFKNKDFPLRKYQEGVFTALLQARDQLRSNAISSGDKTTGLVSTSVGSAAIIDLFFGGSKGLEQFLSLRNANHFYLPMIPSFSPAPPYLYMFAFSLPYPPDNASYADASATSQTLDQLSKDVVKANEEVEKRKKEEAEALAAWQADSGDDSKKHAYENAVAATNAAINVRDGLKSQIENLGNQQTAAVQANAAGGMKGVPPTRSQDPSGNDGIMGWNYSIGIKMLAKLITLFGGFSPSSIADLCGNPDVKLIHFGGATRDYQFVLDDNNMTLDATMTVPRGRTLRLSSPGTITVAGDLWLQRGSTFVADCQKIRVIPGRGSDPSKFFSPCGRIFLEEGATLICSGDVECVGSPQWGSVVVGGVPGKIHPITSAIFARKVQLNSGVFAGSALDDLVEGLGINDATLKAINDDFMRPLMSTIAPNAAKAVGPFHARKPYFAQYATTFQLIFIPVWGVPAIPVPAPIPLPSKNMLVPIARGLGFVFAVKLNMDLGENFYTHSDWWVFGEGVVPMVPQVDPSKVTGAIGSFGSAALDALNPENIIKTFVQSAVKDMVMYVVESIIKEVVAKVAASAIPYGGIVSMAVDLLTSVASNLTGRDTSQKTAGDGLTSALTSAVGTAAKNTLGSLSSKFSTTVENEFLREYNGLLVYADDTIEMGGNMATGYFLAQNNINITAKQCVGALISRNGDITCERLLFFPYFNRASLYIPKAPPSGWLERALEVQYDAGFNSGQAVDVPAPDIPPVISSQGWAQ